MCANRYVHLFALVCGLFAAVPALAIEPLSSQERVAMPPKQAGIQANADLQSILTPPVRFVGQGLRVRHVPQAGFRIQPYGTDLKGVCRKDELLLLYAPVRKDDGDIAMTPYTVQTVSSYQVRHPEQPVESQNLSDGLWDPQCRDQDPNTIGWFQAATPYQAAQAVRTLFVAVEEIKAGRLQPAGCEDVFDKGKTCRDILATYATPALVSYVEPCKAQDGAFCYRISVGDDIDLTITAQDDKGATEPGRILSVTIRQIVIMN